MYKTIFKLLRRVKNNVIKINSVKKAIIDKKRTAINTLHTVIVLSIFT